MPRNASAFSGGRLWRMRPAVIAGWFRRLSRLRLLNWRSFAIWSSRVCWSSRAVAEGFRWSGATGDCKASRPSSTRIAPPRCWLHASAQISLLFLLTPTSSYLDYKKPTQRPLRQVSAAELEEYARAGHFPPGNMGPKIESVLRFLRDGGKEAIITSCENLCQAVAGSAGTHMFPDHDARKSS